MAVKDKGTTQRIDDLLDDRINSIRDDISETKQSVLRIEKILVGNGSEGIIQAVAKLSARQKIVCWVLSIVVSGALGSGVAYFNKDSELFKPRIELSELSELSELNAK